MSGKTVRIYLVDGSPTGVKTAEIINWTGNVTVAPRSQLADLANRAEVKRTGLYILVGDDPNNPLQQAIYVGESDNVWKRLASHNKDQAKDFWQRTVVVTSKDENLTKSHVRYLESRLIQLAKQSQRSTVVNGTVPDAPLLPEPDVADMNYFLGQVQMLLPVLGFNFATPLPSTTELDIGEQKSQHVSPVFAFSYAGTDAMAREIDGEFVVLKDSTARKSNTQSLAAAYIQTREQLAKEGKLVDSADDEYWSFAQDIPFGSPSTAAAIIGGAQLNGRIYWKLKDNNQTYAEWQEAQIEQVAESLSEDEEL